MQIDQGKQVFQPMKPLFNRSWPSSHERGRQGIGQQTPTHEPRRVAAGLRSLACASCFWIEFTSLRVVLLFAKIVKDYRLGNLF